MTSDLHFDLFFNGELATGYTPERAIQDLIAKVGMDRAKASALFSNKRVLVTRNADSAKKERFLEAFGRAGVILTPVPVSQADTSGQAKVESPDRASGPDTPPTPGSTTTSEPAVAPVQATGAPQATKGVSATPSSRIAQPSAPLPSARERRAGWRRHVLILAAVLIVLSAGAAIAFKVLPTDPPSYHLVRAYCDVLEPVIEVEQAMARSEIVVQYEQSVPHSEKGGFSRRSMGFIMQQTIKAMEGRSKDDLEQIRSDIRLSGAMGKVVRAVNTTRDNLDALQPKSDKYRAALAATRSFVNVCEQHATFISEPTRFDNFTEYYTQATVKRFAFVLEFGKLTQVAAVIAPPPDAAEKALWDAEIDRATGLTDKLRQLTARTSDKEQP
jgi:hypothetical protein